MREVCELTASVEYNVELSVAHFCNDAIIFDGALIGHQHGQTRLILLQALSVYDCATLQKSGSIFAAESNLAHVGHIKNAG